MPLLVRVSARARRDIDRLAAFLGDRNPDAGRRALETIAEAVFSLADYAERGRPGRVEGLRELPVPFGRDGYVLQYRVRADEVVIVRIFHTRERR